MSNFYLFFTPFYIMASPNYIYLHFSPKFLIPLFLKITALNLDNNIMVSPKYIYQYFAPEFFIIELFKDSGAKFW